MESKTTINFGEFLHNKREEQEITLRSMAQALEISAPYLSDIEKGRRYAPEIDILNKIAAILHLNSEERAIMLDLAGKTRNEVAPDLPEYIIQRDYVSAALRTAKDLGVGEKEWLEFVQKMKSNKTKK